MSDEPADSLFKLRLTGELRQRLEAEASKRGLTLTAEILRRIDDSFSDVSDRLHALEKIVFDGDIGNSHLDANIGELWKRVDDLERNTSEIVHHWKDGG